ncbi:MAG: protein kinase [Planctomycetaceae bacterium]|jgi:phosphoglycerate dehydrogenase-like enzyme/serine/threonine protein kinase|nr:protein kinase [Planctomycetaceae bacterium]
MSQLVVCFKDTPVEDAHIDRIRSAWSDVEIINVGQKDVAGALLEADFFCGHAKVPVDWDAIVENRRLQWIQSSAAGMDWCLVPSVVDSDIVITTASGVLADQVAEHTLALILAWMRSLPVCLYEQHVPAAPDFRKFLRRPTRDLTRSVVGIVGFGGVGRRIAEVLAPFQTTVLATDLYPSDKPSGVDELWGADKLDDLLQQSDVVILALPLNAKTKGLFNSERFQQMKPDALFVNVARGDIVNTDDLVLALHEGRIAGAVLDVTSPEPLPADHPLWDFFPHVMITPHIGGQSRRRFDDVVDIFVANTYRWQSKQPLINNLSPEGKRLGFPIRAEDTPLWCDFKTLYRSRTASTRTRRKFPIGIPSPNLPDSTTKIFERTMTHAASPQLSEGCSEELRNNYYELLDQQRVLWREDIQFTKMLGQGGQGFVFLSELRGSDGFILPVAIKVFSPERFGSDMLYEGEMYNMAKITAKVARIQHDHLLMVHNWHSANRIHIMSMEWIEGFDLSQLLRQEMLDFLQKNVSSSRWRYINSVVVTGGTMHPRLMPGIAIPIIRECLAALGALHRIGIVHGDIKPSNIMLKQSGTAKLIDIGSAFEVENRPPNRPYTLAYAAPEVLEGKEATPQSDIASLGYVLIEMLSGRRLFNANSELNGIEGRLLLANQLHRILPPMVATSEVLMRFCRSLIAPDPKKRFENAEAADLFKDGAADFLRQLVKGDLACESEPEIRNWLSDLGNYRPSL